MGFVDPFDLYMAMIGGIRHDISDALEVPMSSQLVVLLRDAELHS